MCSLHHHRRSNTRHKKFVKLLQHFSTIIDELSIQTQALSQISNNSAEQPVTKCATRDRTILSNINTRSAFELLRAHIRLSGKSFMPDKARCRRKWQEDFGESKIDDEKYANKVMKCFPELHSRHSRRVVVLLPSQFSKHQLRLVLLWKLPSRGRR